MPGQCTRAISYAVRAPGSGLTEQWDDYVQPVGELTGQGQETTFEGRPGEPSSKSCSYDVHRATLAVIIRREVTGSIR